MVAPAAGYFRVSKHRDGSRASDVYRAQIQRYCEYRDLELSAIYSDIDYSGYHHSERRPGLLQLCEDRHHFSTVVVPKLSRLGRSLKHLCHLFETFETDSIDLVFLDVGVDTGTSQGRLLRNVLAAFAEFESDVKSDYGRANAAFKALGGLPHGKAPYGYRQAPGTGDFVPHAQRALIVQEIFRRYVGGEGTCSIARRMDRRGLTTSRGARGIPMPFVRFSTILFMLAIEDTKDSSMTPHGKPLSIKIRGMRHDGDERGRASRPTETTREPPLGC